MFKPDGYAADNLVSLFAVPNFDTVVERIDVAARTATLIMRQTGMKLSEDARDVPTLDDVDRHLRLLVSEAYDAYVLACTEFPDSDEVDGQAGDDVFDVLLYPTSTDRSKPSALHISIAFLLV